MIVIADDNVLIRKGLTQIIYENKIGDEIIEVDNLKALKQLIDKDFDGLLIYGLKEEYAPFLYHLKKTPELLAHGKVLILDSQVEYDMYKQAKDLGVQGYMLKNASAEDIRDAIGLIMRNKRYYDYDVLSMLERQQSSYGYKLTSREQEIFCNVAKGLSNAEIATSLYISPNTVKKHVSNILGKLDLLNRTQLVLYANKTLM